MPSHMSTLGFPVNTEQDFRHYVYQTSEFGEKIETQNGSYTYWAVGNGIELWVQTNRHKRIIGMNPHFSGSARLWAGIIERIPRYQHSILDGAFYAWAEPCDNHPTKGMYPFVFDLPDYDLHDTLCIPEIYSVQVTAFAHELKAFVNEESYIQAQNKLTKCASESFIPTGLFTSAGTPKEPAQAEASFSAYILDTEMITNPITGQKFYWARVRILGAEMDVIADPQVVQGKLVHKGILWGSFWLSGRLA